MSDSAGYAAQTLPAASAPMSSVSNSMLLMTINTLDAFFITITVAACYDTCCTPPCICTPDGNTSTHDDAPTRRIRVTQLKLQTSVTQLGPWENFSFALQPISGVNGRHLLFKPLLLLQTFGSHASLYPAASLSATTRSRSCSKRS